MILGTGLIANAFLSYSEDKEIILFASGVSNSTEIRMEAFDRERLLLENTCQRAENQLLIYFSTCSVSDKSSLQLGNLNLDSQKININMFYNRYTYS